MNTAQLMLIPAAMVPDAEALVCGEERLSYAVAAERAQRLAGALLAAGAGPGDRVMILDVNQIDAVLALYAAAWLGATAVPVNCRARPDDLAHMVRVARARVILAGASYLPLVRESGALAEGCRLVCFGGAGAPQPDVPAGAVSLDVLAAAGADPGDPAEVDPDGTAVLIFTSGTTSRPTGAPLSFGGLADYVFGAAEPPDGGERGAALLAAPLHHVAGLTAVLTTLFTGRRLVILSQFEAAAWLAAVQRERITHAFLVPTMLKRVLDHPDFSRTDLSSLQVLSYGAAPIAPALIEQAVRAFPPETGFVNAFGQTETTATVIMLGPEDHRLPPPDDPEYEQRLRRLSSIGRPVPGVEIAILDPEQRPLPAGSVGEVAVRAPRTVRGYEGTEQQPRYSADGWLLTSDLGWQDEGGYIFLAGRADDLIIRGGENISPLAVEQVLNQHPEVEESAVVGLPDAEWGQRVAAAVVPRLGRTPTPEALLAYCRERIPGFRRPEVIRVVASLPRNDMGKIVRREIRRRWADL